MRVRSLLISFLGLALAIGSVFFAQKYVIPGSGNQAKVIETNKTEVIVAKVDIPFGQAIEDHMLTTQVWPAEALPPQAFNKIADLVGGDDPRRAKRAMAQGELILASKVSEYGEKVTIVQTLGSNMRAIAIKVNAVSGVGGFVTPGDKVDIVLTQGRGEDLKAVTILQNVRVIGIDQAADEDASDPSIVKTITVEVTPDDGQKLALAQSAGSLSLTLRTLDNVSDKPMEQVRLRDLLLEKSPSEEPVKRSPAIIINRSGVTSTVNIGG